MQKVEVGKPYIYKPDGEMLGKVLVYYGLIPDLHSSNYKIICPFHNDLNPSMAIDLVEGRFFCFGCEASGDAYKFLQLMYPEDNDIQVLKKLFAILKSDKVCALSFSNRVKVIEQSQQLYDEAHDYFYGLSKINWAKDKTDEVIECRAYMSKRGFTAATLTKCDARITYNKAYPIVFPMLDNGEFKGWVCRTNKKEIEQKRKYLYNAGFSRATTLVGDYADAEVVFIVEGYMDRLKFVQYGVDNVVAILGWKMSKNQEQKLKDKKVKIIVSALDNDECGDKGTKYLKTLFPNVVRFSYLRKIKDVGETDKATFDKMYKRTMNNVAKLACKQRV